MNKIDSEKLTEIFRILFEYYETNDVPAFLASKQPLIDDRVPIDLISSGDLEPILAMLRRWEDGVYI